MNFVNWNMEVYEEFCNRAILKPREQDVLRMHVFTDLNCGLIADTLGYSPDTVKKDLRRCKDKYIAEAAHSPLLFNAIYKDSVRMTVF